MKRFFFCLIFFICIQSVSYADGFGEGAERIKNITDALSEALCLDSTNDNKKITRSDYFRLTLDSMNKMKMEYKHAKMLAEIIIKDAYAKCPENF